jgi:16S rRNA (uracil1498-N3)-methyltransferase
LLLRHNVREGGLDALVRGRKTDRAFVIVGTIESGTLTAHHYQLSAIVRQMSERFFSSKPIAAERATLDGPEAHHLLHVMRAKVGDSVALFDDTGAEFAAVVDQLNRSEVELRIVERREINCELPFALIIGVALPKGDRQKWLVEKLTELGVTTLVPLITEHSVAVPSDSAIDRLRRAVIEAAKQCGRNRLMQISSPQAWNQWATGNCELTDQTQTRRLLGHPDGVPLSELAAEPAAAHQLAIGPEGGFTDGEVSAAVAAGWQTVSLGPRVLRIETAAIALAAAMSLHS